MLALSRESVRVLDFNMGPPEHIGGEDRVKLNQSIQDNKVEVVVRVFAKISLDDDPSSTKKEPNKLLRLPILPHKLEKTTKDSLDIHTAGFGRDDSEDDDDGENEESGNDASDYDNDTDEVLQERGPMCGRGRSAQKFRPYDTKSTTPSPKSDSSQSSSPDSSPRHEPSLTRVGTSLSGGSCIVFSESERPSTSAIDIEKPTVPPLLSGGGIITPPRHYYDTTPVKEGFPINFSSSPSVIPLLSVDNVTSVSFKTFREHPEFGCSVSSPASSTTTDEFGAPSPFTYYVDKDCSSQNALLDDFKEKLPVPLPPGLYVKSLSHESVESNSQFEVDDIQPSLLPEDNSVSASGNNLHHFMEYYGVESADVQQLASDKEFPPQDDDDDAKFEQYFESGACCAPEAVERFEARKMSSSSATQIRPVTTKYRRILPKPSPPSADSEVAVSAPTPTYEYGKRPLRVTAKERLKLHFSDEKLNAAFELVDCGKINLTEKDVSGDTNLHISIEKNELELTYAITETLCKEQPKYGSHPLNMANDLGQTPLFVAVVRKNKLVVDYLLECGANPSLACRDGTTPLHYVAKKGVEYFEIAESLCRSPAISLNQTNRHGFTPLHCAVQNDEEVDTLPIIKILLACDADLNIEDSRNGKTALIMAVEKADIDAVKALCESCSKITEKINHKIYHGTALHFAALLNNVAESVQISIIEILLRHGANCIIKNRQNKCPKNLADKQRVKVKELLRTPRNKKC